VRPIASIRDETPLHASAVDSESSRGCGSALSDRQGRGQRKMQHPRNRDGEETTAIRRCLPRCVRSPKPDRAGAPAAAGFCVVGMGRQQACSLHATTADGGAIPLPCSLKSFTKQSVALSKSEYDRQYRVRLRSAKLWTETHRDHRAPSRAIPTRRAKAGRRTRAGARWKMSQLATETGIRSRHDVQVTFPSRGDHRPPGRAFSQPEHLAQLARGPRPGQRRATEKLER